MRHPVSFLQRFDYFIGAVAVAAFFLLIADVSSYFERYVSAMRIANLAILSLFILDVLLRFILSPSKKQHLRRFWFDAIVFIPLAGFFLSARSFSASVMLRQLIIIVILTSRLRKANKLITLLSLKPAQLMILSFASAIGVGTVLLMLPLSSASGSPTPLLDAVFTATSATCVTGLAVRDTATHFSLFGQTVILGLIQIGGLGIMTFSVSLALLLGRRLEMQRQIVMREVLDQETLVNVKDVAVFIFRMTLFFEVAGALGLFWAWRGRFPDAVGTAYHSVFHSVSAFCNAGFSTFSDSLMRFSADFWTNLIVCLLIIAGGLGFTVFKDLSDNIRNRLRPGAHRIFSLKVQTKIVLSVSVLLVVFGALALYLAEYRGAFAGLGLREKILSSVFQSVTARTAGFNTCDIAGLSSASVFILIVLMFIGGSPGSTAGGIKTSTLGVLWAVFVSEFKQREDVIFFRRAIPQDVVQKAMSVFLMSLAVVVLFGSLLLFFERRVFADVLFETVSAFGTVGLSRGLTPQLTVAGKALITALMFIGRLGPLTIGYALSRTRKPVRVRYAQQRLMIG